MRRRIESPLFLCRPGTGGGGRTRRVATLRSATALTTGLLAIALFAAPAAAQETSGGAGGGPTGGAGGLSSAGGIPGNGGNGDGTGGGGGGGAGSIGGSGGTGESAGGTTLGGSGGPSPGANGGNGVSSGISGSGGGGGAHGYVGATLPTSDAEGGSGGQGGFGDYGGGGGAGGYGAVITAGGDLGILGSSVLGGTGGFGGAGSFFAGLGGQGGSGLVLTAPSTITISAQVTGGQGAPAIFGPAGAGGYGLVGSDLTIDLRALIIGGANGDGFTRAAAISFTGGTNSLTGGAGNGVVGRILANGALTLDGNNDLIGGIALNGTLRLLSSGAAGGSGNAITTATGSTISFANGIDNASPIVLNSEIVQLEVAGADSATQSGAISETGGPRPITKTGAGTLILTGANTYTGSTTISAGTLQVGAGGASGSLGTGPVIDNGALVFNRSDTISVSNLISGTGSLTQAGSGTLLLTNAGNNYGATLVTGGILQLDDVAAFGSGPLALGGGHFRVNASGTIVAGFSNARDATSTFSVTAGNTVTLQTAANALGGVEGMLHFGTATDTGTLEIVTTTFSSNDPPIFFIDGGTLRLSGANVSLYAGYAQRIEIAAGATLDLGGTNFASGPFPLRNLQGAGTLVNDGGRTVIASGNFSGIITGSTDLIKGNDSSGSNLLILSGANDYSGTTTISSGTLQIGDGGTGGTLGTGDVSIGSGANLTFNRSDDISFAGPISGDGSLTQAGSGRLTLSGSNSYGGGTSVTAGTLRLEAADSAGTGAIDFGANTLSLAGFLTYANDLVADGGTIDFEGFVSLTGAISGSGVRFTTPTSGQVSLLNTGNSYGTTSIGPNLSVAIGDSSANGSLGTGDVTLESDRAVLILRGNGAQSFANRFLGNGYIWIENGASTELTGSNAAGSGFTGEIWANAGTLLINGAVGDLDGNSAKILLNFGGSASRLGGTGTFYGDVVGTGPATIAPGNSPGTLTIAGNLQLQPSTTVEFELGEEGVVGGANNDLIIVGGELYRVDSTINVVSLAGSGYYRLFNYGTLSGTDFGALNLPGGFTGTLLYNQAGQINLRASDGSAITQYWDGSDTDGSSLATGGDGGSGTWNSSLTNWTAGGSFAINDSWQQGIAVFAGANSGTVSVEGTQGFAGLGFQTDGYVLVQGTGGALQSSSDSAAIDVASGIGATVSAPLVGGFGFTKTGDGILTLRGDSYYGGPTTIQGGLINFAYGGNLGNGAITLDGGGLQWASGNSEDISARLNAIGAGGGNFDTNGNNVTFASALSGGALLKSGDGTLTLTANNSYGITTVSGGNLRVGDGVSSGTLGTGDINVYGATLVFDRGDNVAYANALNLFGTLIQAGAGTVTLQGSNFVQGAIRLDNGLLEFASPVTFDEGSLLTFNGGSLRQAVDQTWDGFLSLRWNAQDASALSVATGSTLTIYSALSIENGVNGNPTLRFGATGDTGTITLNSASDLTADGTGALVVAGGRLQTQFGNDILNVLATGLGSVQIDSPGILDLSGGTDFTDTQAIRSLTGNGGLVLGGVTRILEGSFSGAISGAGDLIKTGTGTLALTGFNTYSGITSILGGTLEFGGGALFGTSLIEIDNATLRALSPANAIFADISILSGGATIDTGAFSIDHFGSISFGGLLTKTGSGLLILEDGNDLTEGDGGINVLAGSLALGGDFAAGTGLISLADGTTLVNASCFCGLLELDNNIAIADGGTATFDGQGLDMVLNGVLSGGSINFVARTGQNSEGGGSTFVLTNFNTYTDTILGANVALILFGDPFNDTNGTLGGGNTIFANVPSNPSTPTTLVFANLQDYGYEGSIIGNGQIVVLTDPSIAISLYGSNSSGSNFTGTVTVDSGRLNIEGDFGDLDNLGASLIVNNCGCGGAATLGGSGTFFGNVTIGDGTLAAGNSPGTLNIAGNLTLGAGTVLNYEFGQPGVVGANVNDFVTVGGNLTLDGTLNIINFGPSYGPGYYRLFRYGGTLTDNGLTPGTIDGPLSVSLLFNIPGQVNLLLGPQVIQYWDGTDTTGAASGSGATNGNGGSGTWNASNTNWTGATGFGVNDQWRSTVGVFAGAAGGTVTVAGVQTFQDLRFQTDNYLLRPADASARLQTTGGHSVIDVAAGLTADIGVVIQGAAGLQKDGAGTLLLSANNSYTGLTDVTAGTLRIGVDSAISNASALNVEAGATFDVGGFFQSVAALTGAGNVTVADGNFQFGFNGASTSFSGAISGQGVVRKNGVGTFTLAGSVDLGGTSLFAVDGGALNVAAAGSITSNLVQNFATMDNAGTITAAIQNFSNFTNDGTIVGGTLSFGAFTNNGSMGSLGINGGSATNSGTINGFVNNFTSFTSTGIVNGALNNFGTALVQNQINGDLINAIGGATTTLTGTLTGLTLYQGANGSTLDLAGFDTAIGALSGFGDILLGSATLTVGGTNANSTFNGVISGSGALTKVGTGDQTLGGLNTYSGLTTVSGGTLTIASGGGLAGDVATSATFSNAGTVAGFVDSTGTVINSGTLDNGARSLGVGAVFTTTGIINPLVSGLALTNGGTVNARGQINGLIQNLGVFNVTGTLTGVTRFNMFAGSSLALQDNDFAVGGLGGTGSVDLGAATLTVGVGDLNSTFGGVISGSGGLTKVGADIFTLTGANTYTGTTTVSGGTLRVAAGGNIVGPVVNNATLENFAVIDGNVANNGVYTQIGTLNGGLTNNGAAAIRGVLNGNVDNQSGSITLTGLLTGLAAFNQSAGASFNLANFDATIGSLAGAGDVLLGSARLTLGGNDGSTTFAGAISGSGGITKMGAGTLTLSGANSYTGATNVDGGTLLLGANSALDGNTALTVATGATFDLASFTTQIATLSGGGTVQGSSGQLDVGGTNGNSLFTGAFAGSLVVSKSGTGSMTLTGNSSLSRLDLFQGTTTLTGTAVLNGAVTVYGTGFGGSPVLINDGVINGAVGALAGGSVDNNGTINGTASNSSVSFTNDGTISNIGNYVLFNNFGGVFTNNAGGLIEGNVENGAFASLATLNNAGTITGDILNYAGGTLNSTGTINGFLDNYGTVSLAGQLNGTITNRDDGTVTLTGVTTGITGYGGQSANAILDLAGFDTAIDGIGGLGQIRLGNATLTIGAHDVFSAFSGVISGNGGLTKIGANLASLSGANSYTGLTTVSGGTLRVESTGSLAGDVLNNARFDNDGLVAGLVTNNATANNGGTFLSGVINNGTLNSFGRIDVGVLNNVGATLMASGQINGVVDNRGVVNAGPITGITSFVQAATGVFNLLSSSLTVGALDGSGAVNLAAHILTVNVAGSSTFDGVIAGLGGVTKAGAGTFTLSGANTYTGQTRIDSGTLNVTGSLAGTVLNFANLANSGTIAGEVVNDTGGNALNTGTMGGGVVNFATFQSTGIVNGGLINLGTASIRGALNGTVDNRAGTITLTGATSGIGRVSQESGAIFDLAGFSTSFGSLDQGGEVRLGGATLAVGGDDSSSVFGGSITGGGNLIKTGAGTLALNGSNSFSGSVRVASGELVLDGNSALTGPNLVTVDAGAALYTGDTFQPLGALAGAGTISVGSGGALSIGNGGLSATFSGTIGSGSVLSKEGAGTQTFSGAATFGIIFINDGELRIGAGGTLNASFGNNSIFTNLGTINGSGSNNNPTSLFTNGGRINGGVVNNGILDNSGTITDRVDNNLTFVSTGSIGALGNSGDAQIRGELNGRVDGRAGIITLTGTTTGIGLVNQVAGALFNLNGFNTAFGALRGAGEVRLGGAILTVGGDNSSDGFAGIITGSGASGLTKVGTGTLTLSGSNTYTGTTNVNGGTLTLASTGRIAGNVVNLATFNNDGRVDLVVTNNAGATAGNSGTIAGGVFNSGTFGTTGIVNVGIDTTSTSLINARGQINGFVANRGTFNVTGALTGIGIFLQAGTGQTNLNGNNLTVGALQGDGGVALGGATLTTGDASNVSFFGRITGTGNLTKVGAGTLTLAGANTFAGLTTVSAGQLNVSVSGSLASAVLNNNLLENRGAIGGLVTNNRIMVSYGTMGGGLINSAGAQFNNDTLAIITGAVRNDGRLDNFGTINGTVTNTATLLSARAINGGLVNSGTVLLGGALNGVLTNNAGTVTLGGTITGITALNQLAGALFDLNGFSTAIGGLTGAGEVRLGGATLTVGGSNTNDGFAGIITGAGASGLTKVGTGTLSLSGSNTYTGTTNVNAGTLTLASTGRIAGNVVNLATFNNDGRVDLVVDNRVGGNFTNSGTVGLGLINAGTATSTGIINGGLVNSGAAQLRGQLNGFVNANGGTITLTGVLTGITTFTQAAGATLNLNGFSLSLGALSGAGSILFGGAATPASAGTTPADATSGAAPLWLVAQDSAAPDLATAAAGAGTSPAASTAETPAAPARTWLVVQDSAAPDQAGGLAASNGRAERLGMVATETATGAPAVGLVAVESPMARPAVAGGQPSDTGGALVMSISGGGGETVPISADAGAAVATTDPVRLSAGGSTLTPLALPPATGPVLTVGSGNVDTLFSGVISGNGRLAKVGTGTLVLTGDNTYTDGTLISAGVLQLGNGGTSGSILGRIENNAILVVNRSNALTLSGIIDGTGLFVQAGTGTTTLTAANAYTGGTLIQAGRLRGDAVSLQGNIQIDGGTLEFNQATAGTFGGRLFGAGAVEKSGAGLLTFGTDNSNLTGGTTILGGELRVNGLLSRSRVTVGNGGSLSGTSIVGGIVAQSGGTVAPGAGTFGTLGVNGAIQFLAGSTFAAQVQVAGSDLLLGNGTAQLAGTIAVAATPGAYRFNSIYVLLQADAGRTGTFGVETGLNGFGQAYAPRIVYTPTQVQLLMAPASLIGIAGADGTPNQRSTLTRIDAAVAAGYDPQPLIALYNLTPRAAFLNGADQLSGEVYATSVRAALDDERLVREATFARLRLTQDMGFGAGFGMWGHAVGSWGSGDTDGNAARYERDQQGFVVGIDGGGAWAGGSWRIGLLGHHLSTDIRVDARGSNAEIERSGAGIYGGLDFGSVRIRAGGTYSSLDLEGRRTAAFTGFSETLSGETDGSALQGFAEIAYRLQVGAASHVEPYFQAALAHVEFDAFSETGGASRLSVAAESDDLTVLSFGLRGSSVIPLGGNTNLRLDGALGGRHLSGDRTIFSLISLDASPAQAFDIRSAAMDRFAVTGQADATFEFGRSVSLSVGYSGVISSNARDHAARATLGIRF